MPHVTGLSYVSMCVHGTASGWEVLVAHAALARFTPLALAIKEHGVDSFDVIDYGHVPETAAHRT